MLLFCGQGWGKEGRRGGVGEGGEGVDGGDDRFLRCLDREDSCICSRERG